jgi:hypothetical protein
VEPVFRESGFVFKAAWYCFQVPAMVFRGNASFLIKATQFTEKVILLVIKAILFSKNQDVLFEKQIQFLCAV